MKRSGRYYGKSRDAGRRLYRNRPGIRSSRRNPVFEADSIEFNPKKAKRWYFVLIRGYDDSSGYLVYAEKERDAKMFVFDFAEENHDIALYSGRGDPSDTAIYKIPWLISFLTGEEGEVICLGGTNTVPSSLKDLRLYGR